MVLYCNQLSVNFILHSAEFQNDSSIRYENALYGTYFLNCYIVTIILISFNCFSEYLTLKTWFYVFLKLAKKYWESIFVHHTVLIITLACSLKYSRHDKSSIKSMPMAGNFSNFQHYILKSHLLMW